VVNTVAAKKIKTQLSYEKVLAGVQELPSLPTVQAEIISAINDPMTSIKEIEELMLTDQGLTTKVLKLINSAYYAIPGGVKDLGRAIGFLGFNTVNQLVLSTSIVNSLKFSKDCSFNVAEFWKHSIGVAITSETTGKFLNVPGNDYFVAGLIHDIGKLALLKIDEKLLLEVSTQAKEQNKSFYAIEVQDDLPKHAIIGALLAEKWKFPENLKSAIKYHHTADAKLRVGLNADVSRFVDVVFYANALMHEMKFGHSGYDVVEAMPPAILQSLKINESNAAGLAAAVTKKLEMAGQLLNIITGAE
jgi:putative nucleotidyltransferase with HDIG domain